jgi:transposase-like protein
MVRRERTFYSEEFKKMVVAAYLNTEEPMSEIASRFKVNVNTVESWYRRECKEVKPEKNIKFVATKTDLMGKTDLSPETMEARIRELEQQLEVEKMRGECLEKMIEIAERDLKIDIRKKSGARQSMR